MSFRNKIGFQHYKINNQNSIKTALLSYKRLLTLTLLKSFNHGCGSRWSATDAVKQSILDHLRHEAVDHFDGGLAGVLGRLPQFVFSALLNRIRTGH